MTRDSVIQMLMIIQASYPNYKPPDKTVTVNMWYEMLQEYDEASAMTALKEFIKTDTSGFAPSIGQIVAKIDLVKRRMEINHLEQMLLQETSLRIGGNETKLISGD